MISIFESSSRGGGKGILGANFLTDFKGLLFGLNFADAGGNFSLTETELEEVGLTGAFLVVFITGDDSDFTGLVGAFRVGLGLCDVIGFGGLGGGFRFGLFDSDEVVLEFDDAKGLLEFSSFELSS